MLLPHVLPDCDEIPRPSFIEAMKQCDGVTFPLAMGSALHYYSFSLKPTSKVKNLTQQGLYMSNAPHITSHGTAAGVRNAIDAASM